MLPNCETDFPIAFANLRWLVNFFLRSVAVSVIVDGGVDFVADCIALVSVASTFRYQTQNVGPDFGPVCRESHEVMKCDNDYRYIRLINALKVRSQKKYRGN